MPDAIASLRPPRKRIGLPVANAVGPEHTGVAGGLRHAEDLKALANLILGIVVVFVGVAAGVVWHYRLNNCLVCFF